MGILSLLLWTPALGGLLLLCIPERHTAWIRWVANLFGTIALLLSGWLLSLYDSHNPALQLTEYVAVNPSLGSAYSLGVDGLSTPMLALSSLLTSAALLASLKISAHVKAYHLSILVLEFGMLGVFLAQDWVLFYIFWELTLIPLFFLISRWGGKQCHTASLNFVFYSLGGSVFMLLSLLAVSQYTMSHDGSLMTSLQHSLKDMPLGQQVWVLLGFLLGFGVKLPIFPLHGWLPLVHVEAPAPVSILLAGVFLKMAAYGLLRALIILPDAAHALQPWLVLLALIGILYGGLLAWRQSDLKAMVAYASISYMNQALLGIACLNQAGITAALLQMTAHGLLAGALFLLVGLLDERGHSRNVLTYGGLIQTMPRWSLLMVFSLLAALAMPGFIGFIAQLQLLIAFFQQWGWLWIFLGLSMLITAAYIIRTLGLLFLGAGKPHTPPLYDLRPLEMLAAGVLVGALALLGLLPEPLLALSASTAAQMHRLLNAG
jgi:NADH-quinone oxidoreductase subunit M